MINAVTCISSSYPHVTRIGRAFRHQRGRADKPLLIGRPDVVLFDGCGNRALGVLGIDEADEGGCFVTIFLRVARNLDQCRTPENRVAVDCAVQFFVQGLKNPLGSQQPVCRPPRPCPKNRLPGHDENLLTERKQAIGIAGPRPSAASVIDPRPSGESRWAYAWTSDREKVDLPARTAAAGLTCRPGLCLDGGATSRHQ
jgi:hypothetical protein